MVAWVFEGLVYIFGRFFGVATLSALVTGFIGWIYSLFADGVKNAAKFTAKQVIKKFYYLAAVGFFIALDIAVTTWFLNSFEFIPFNGNFYSLFGFFEYVTTGSPTSAVASIIMSALGINYILGTIYYFLFAMIIIKSWQRIFTNIVIVQ